MPSPEFTPAPTPNASPLESWPEPTEFVAEQATPTPMSEIGGESPPYFPLLEVGGAAILLIAIVGILKHRYDVRHGGWPNVY